MSLHSTIPSTTSPNPLKPLQRKLRTLNSLRIPQPILPPHLIHRLHNNNALLPRQHLALQLPIPQAARALVRLPEHAVTGDIARDPLELEVSQRAARVGFCGDQRVGCGAVGWALHLNLAERALDPDRGAGGALGVRVMGDLDGC